MVAAPDAGAALGRSGCLDGAAAHEDRAHARFGFAGARPDSRAFGAALCGEDHLVKWLSVDADGDIGSGDLVRSSDAGRKGSAGGGDRAFEDNDVLHGAVRT